MNSNVGMTERIVRIALGLAILPVFFFLEDWLRWVGLIGILPIVTGVMGWCPGYFALGIKLEESPKQ